MMQCLFDVAREESGARYATMSQHNGTWFFGLMGTRDDLTSNFSAGRILGSHHVVHPQSEQDQEFPRRIAHALTELPRPRERLSNLQGCVSFQGPQRGSEVGLKYQLLPVALDPFRYPLQGREACRDMTNGLCIGKALDSTTTSF